MRNVLEVCLLQMLCIFQLEGGRRVKSSCYGECKAVGAQKMDRVSYFADRKVDEGEMICVSHIHKYYDRAKADCCFIGCEFPLTGQGPTVQGRARNKQ